jgi:hypothetical protein
MRKVYKVDTISFDILFYYEVFRVVSDWAIEDRSEDITKIRIEKITKKA